MIGTRYHDLGDGRIAVQRHQDVESILEQAKALHADGRGKSASGELYHAASIPAVLVEAYCNKAGITLAECLGDETHVKRLLNDPDLSCFRIWKGRI